MLSTRDVADRLKMTPSGVSRMVARGELTPALQMPGKRGAFLFDERKVAKLAEGRTDE
jgi:hypothetical protein